ncbi:MAG TPA: acyl-CoA dehydrogenase [Kiloniellales bacterium]|nr:acyl-CoA dehydrogenase [Kiloniellales bacterium]
MPRYRAPLDEIRFVLHEVLGAEKALAETGAFPGLDRALIDQVLEEAGRLAGEVVQPINQGIDAEGCRLENGGVTTPAALRRAYRAWVDGGWNGLTAEADDGGQGLPEVVAFAVNEMVTSASMGFADYVGLFAMVYRMVKRHGTPEQQERYLRGLADGRFGGTMMMTEPHCGTDVGLIKTKAMPAADGTWRLSGTKIFISGGDHDLTENIVHLVLARAEGDPAGSRGLSLFVVPKLLPDGTRNALAAVSLEHKMGYAASATCQMALDGASGWLLGEQKRGLMVLFDMMNAARLIVGSQGLATASAAYQIAAPYAAERLQGRSPRGAARPEAPADPILCHPDVRRMLLGTRAFVEAARLTYLWLGLEVDLAARHPDEARRREAAEWLALLTATVKAVLSDLGFAATNDCLQVLGGHGYIRANGVEQLLRDGRIAMIQEGANGMLALDLIRRQIPRDEGRAWKHLLNTMAKSAATVGEPELTNAMHLALRRLQAASDWLQAQIATDPAEAGAAGVDFQRLFGLTLLAWQWLRLVEASAKAKEAGRVDAAFHAEKLASAKFWFARVLPLAEGHWAAMQAGAAPIMDPPAEHFAVE